VNTIKLAAVITGPTINEAMQQMARATHADILELRLDLFFERHLSVISHLIATASKPVICTLRSSQHGGKFSGSVLEQCSILKKLIQLKPHYIDLEAHLPKECFKECSYISPNTEVICSYHNFDETPSDLDAVLEELEQKPAHLYKIATWAKSSIDSLRMLLFLKKQRSQKLIGVCMGEHGQATRILSSIFGNSIAFASLKPSEFSTIALLDLQTLVKTYRIRQHNRDTKIYILIGDPVTLSQSHVTHNQVLDSLKQNAVYLKMRVKAEELPAFFKMSKELSIKGMSVTMPLKEHVGAFFNCGPINTISNQKEEMLVDNTDAPAVVSLLQAIINLNEKKVIILGAGGTAKAIAKALLQYGVQLLIFNRTFEKAYALAQKLNAKAHALEDFTALAQEGFDVLINCTSVGFNDPHSSPIPLIPLPRHCIVMDVVSKPKETLFVRYAKAQGCTVIDGRQVFALQAAKQFAFWLDTKVEKPVHELLQKILTQIFHKEKH